MTDDHGPNGKATTETAPEAMDRQAAELDGVQRKVAGGAVDYARGGLVFAAREGRSLSFRLRPEVVDAALRTPDTARSSRGSQWISLSPTEMDPSTLDRVTAWFESAWRLAGESSPGGTSLH
ncbi:MAG: hypothetical protein ABSE58_08005 [Candidatus Limnocylindrales bacterium]|jgi:hypothetical protein